MHSTFVRECGHWSVEDQRNEFGETEPALCSMTYTCTHTKYKKPQITFWIQKKETFWLLHTLWVKSKINRCADTDYITVTDTIISSGLRTECQKYYSTTNNISVANGFPKVPLVETAFEVHGKGFPPFPSHSAPKIWCHMWSSSIFKTLCPLSGMNYITYIFKSRGADTKTIRGLQLRQKSS